jgi:glutathione S-transferase
MKPYGFFWSSAAFRVRIALDLKRLDHESAFSQSRRGHQSRSDDPGVNPQGLVAGLETDGETPIRSLPLNEYLDGRHPDLPRAAGAAHTGAFCHGDAPSPADVALVPQVVNSERYDRAPFEPSGACMALEAFAAAYPDAQPDRER